MMFVSAELENRLPDKHGQAEPWQVGPLGRGAAEPCREVRAVGNINHNLGSLKAPASPASVTVSTSEAGNAATASWPGSQSLFTS